MLFHPRQPATRNIVPRTLASNTRLSTINSVLIVRVWARWSEGKGRSITSFALGGKVCVGLLSCSDITLIAQRSQIKSNNVCDRWDTMGLEHVVGVSEWGVLPFGLHSNKPCWLLPLLTAGGTKRRGREPEPAPKQNRGPRWERPLFNLPQNPESRGPSRSICCETTSAPTPTSVSLGDPWGGGVYFYIAWLLLMFLHQTCCLASGNYGLETQRNLRNRWIKRSHKAVKVYDVFRTF